MVEVIDRIERDLGAFVADFNPDDVESSCAALVEGTGTRPMIPPDHPNNRSN